MATLVRKETFILTDLKNNNNKFWTAELYDDGRFISRYGRVGETGQSKDWGCVGAGQMEAKIREKTGKGYKAARVIDNEATQTAAARTSNGRSALANQSLVSVAQAQISTNDSVAAQLVARLAQANVHNILNATTLSYNATTGLFSTPLGIVTASAIADARKLLTDMASYVGSGRWDDDQFARTASDYMMLVPQDIGRGRPNLRYLYPDQSAIQKQAGILDSLEASLQTVLTQPKAADGGDKQAQVEKVFDLKLHRVEDGRTIDRIRDFYRKTRKDVHVCAHLGVKQVFAVEMPSALAAFEEKGRPLGNVWELWHGTKIANVLSIMKSGLRCAPPNTAAIAGKMFGNGIYFSDQSTKSLNYAYGYWDGKREDNCFMFLANVAMGNYYTPSGPSQQLPKPGYHSTYAVGGRSGVMNNEMIVYRDYQQVLTYLIEFSPQGR